MRDNPGRASSSVSTPLNPARTHTVKIDMMKQQQQVAMAVLVLVLVLADVGGASAASCNVSQLAVCAPALSSGAAPTSACCSSLKAQQSCFCLYAKNPAYGRYINSPNAKKIIASCGLTVPRC